MVALGITINFLIYNKVVMINNNLISIMHKIFVATLLHFLYVVIVTHCVFILMHSAPQAGGFCFMPLFKYHIREELQRYVNTGLYICLCSYSLLMLFILMQICYCILYIHLRLTPLDISCGANFTIKEHSQSFC